MKRNTIHIIYSRLLLIVFIAGQVILYGHQHSTPASYNKARSSSQQTITEKCQLCDAMHVNHSVIQQQLHVAAVLSATWIYEHLDYDFISLKLVRSAGRSPPLS